MATPAQGQADSRSLLELAIDIHTDLGKLATGLAHAGANPQAVAALQRIAVVVGEISKVLGAGPVGGQSQPEGAAPAPTEAPAAAPAAQQAAPQGPMPGERPNGFHQASADLQAALASKHAAAQRALAGQ